MELFARLSRLIHIHYVLLKHGLGEMVLATPLFRPVRFLAQFPPIRWESRHKKPRGIRIREALEELGPIFVKFGQVMSTRFDIIPEDIVKELVRLQDQVPAFSGEIAKKTIETALGSPLHTLFKNFESTALASASIAQVHAATLLEGQAVVVKVLRPNIHKIIKRDIELLKTIANLMHKYSKKARRFKPRELVCEFETTLFHELDLTREAANASQLKRNFNDSTILYVPKIYWNFTKNNILVMERIYGISISNIEALKKEGFDLKAIAKRGIEIFFTQAFRDCFFHADLHPGNLLISTADIKNPQFIAVDFGIMGVLSQGDQRYLAENFIAFLKRDYRRVAELHVESGWVPTNIRMDEFESAIRAICEPIFERPLQEVSFGNILFRFFQIAMRYEVNIQPQLLLLQKTLVNIEGLSRQLNPEIDLWAEAESSLEKWGKKQVGFHSLIRGIRTYGPYWIEKMPQLPSLFYDALTALAGNRHNTVLQEPPTVTQQISTTSIKDICIGILFGVSLSLAGWIVAEGYF